jgi:hypothetical protein|tara:strand:+ start:4003 stop:4188 length:186 start_codon:yes stop_codon:yes gene_type:complete
MARTTRRREPSEIVNPNRGIKKNKRRNDRKSSKKKLQEIDHLDPEAWDEYQEDRHIVRGND